MVLYQAGGSAATSAAIGHANLTDLLGGGGYWGKGEGETGESCGGALINFRPGASTVFTAL